MNKARIQLNDAAKLLWLYTLPLNWWRSCNLLMTINVWCSGGRNVIVEKKQCERLTLCSKFSTTNQKTRLMLISEIMYDWTRISTFCKLQLIWRHLKFQFDKCLTALACFVNHNFFSIKTVEVPCKLSPVKEWCAADLSCSRMTMCRWKIV